MSSAPQNQYHPYAPQPIYIQAPSSSDDTPWYVKAGLGVGAAGVGAGGMAYAGFHNAGKADRNLTFKDYLSTTLRGAGGDIDAPTQRLKEQLQALGVDTTPRATDVPRPPRVGGLRRAVGAAGKLSLLAGLAGYLGYNNLLGDEGREKVDTFAGDQIRRHIPYSTQGKILAAAQRGGELRDQGLDRGLELLRQGAGLFSDEPATSTLPPLVKRV